MVRKNGRFFARLSHFFRSQILRIHSAFALLAGLIALSGCTRVERVEHEISPTPSPTAAPTPKPSPTLIYVPSKRLETGKLFNGLELHSTVEPEAGTTASTERNTLESYRLDLQLHVRIPKPNTSLSELSMLNESLPKVLPGLETLLAAAKVSPFYETLYRLKLNNVQQNLARLDQILSRHDFYDCETMLELQQPETKRKALLIQADMDVDSDGSDGDRVAYADGSSPTFQPMTNYKWPKKTAVPNPFLASREAKLKQLEADLVAERDAPAQRKDQLRNSIGAVRYEVNELKKNSFLVSETDPYVVLPGSILSQSGQPFSPRLGDFCVVIFKDNLYPAIIGDIGPSMKIGEASLRLAKELNAKATSENRPVSTLKVTYLVFPNTADKPFVPPNLDMWYARCEALLNEIGGHLGELHAWEDLTKPPPTPTPSPSPSASPVPSIATSPSPSASPMAAASASPAPKVSVTASPAQ